MKNLKLWSLVCLLACTAGQASAEKMYKYRVNRGKAPRNRSLRRCGRGA